jgi:hypothetical protein
MGEFETIRSAKDTHYDEAAWIFRKAECSILIVKQTDKIERIYNNLE